MHETFLAHRQYLYLKIAGGLAALSALAYALHSPPSPPNGGTWLGYALGTLGALLIVWLAWFGVRKRQYASTLGSLKDWLSGHVYLGASLIVVATLHTGFEFGWNIHTLAYVLMILVILSGFFGIYTYWRYPALLTENRAGQTDEAMLAEIAELDERALSLASKIGEKAHQVVMSSVQRTFGGEVQKDENPVQVVSDTVSELKTQFFTAGSGVSPEATMFTRMAAAGEENQETIYRISRSILKLDDERSQQASELLGLLTEKKALVAKLQRDLRYHRLLKEWLTLHIPLSMMLLAALAVHVVTVFLYW